MIPSVLKRIFINVWKETLSTMEIIPKVLVVSLQSTRSAMVFLNSFDETPTILNIFHGTEYPPEEYCTEAPRVFV